MTRSDEGITYLASPYSHDDPAVRQARYERVCREAAKLMSQGEQIFCPIAHSHPIELAMLSMGLPPIRDSLEFWMHQDLPILRACARIKVLMMPGYRKSKGIARELEECDRRGIPVIYILDTENLPQVGVRYDYVKWVG